MKPPPELSVVIICRNQREGVVRAVRSVLRDRFLPSVSHEILVVDSASTDGTWEVLAGLPVRRARVDESPLLCASLGRCVGTDRTSGETILFLDGDMELAEGFLPAAFSALERHPESAGVIGQVFEEDPGVPGGVKELFRIQREEKAAKFGGAVLFRRDPLVEAGGYDPYIFNREENELHSRIRRRGRFLLQIPFPMAVHHDPPASAAEKFFREVLPARKRPLGRSQAFLQALRKGHLLAYCRREWLFFFSLAADAASFAAFFAPGRIAVWGPLFLQLVSLSVHGYAWSSRQYVLNKIAALQFIAGLFIAPLLLRTPLPRVSESAP